jgi:Tol biopolymer transport system component
VAPDESFLIVSCWNRPDNRGVSDLYISFRNSNGEWSRLQNMGESLNSDLDENCPTLSPDGKYFFFDRRNPVTGENNIYWVDARIIENLNPFI